MGMVVGPFGKLNLTFWTLPNLYAMLKKVYNHWIALQRERGGPPREPQAGGRIWDWGRARGTDGRAGGADCSTEHRLLWGQQEKEKKRKKKKKKKNRL